MLTQKGIATIFILLVVIILVGLVSFGIWLSQKQTSSINKNQPASTTQASPVTIENNKSSKTFILGNFTLQIPETDLLKNNYNSQSKVTTSSLSGECTQVEGISNLYLQASLSSKPEIISYIFASEWSNKNLKYKDSDAEKIFKNK